MTNKTDQLTPRRRPSQERSRERVERILDATMQGYAAQPGYLQLLLSIRPTPEFRVITDESNERVAAMLALHPALQAVISDDQIELVTRAAIQAANSLQDWALSESDPQLANRIIGEMKTLLKGYLSVYMDGSSRYRR